MFEDIARNLEAPHALGMTTVLVTSPDNNDASIIERLDGGDGLSRMSHHVTDDLAGFCVACERRRSASRNRLAADRR